MPTLETICFLFCPDDDAEDYDDDDDQDENKNRDQSNFCENFQDEICSLFLG